MANGRRVNPEDSLVCHMAQSSKAARPPAKRVVVSKGRRIKIDLALFMKEDYGRFIRKIVRGG
jgi:hypothetical protein